MDKNLVYLSIDAYLTHFHKFKPQNAVEFKESFFANPQGDGWWFHLPLLTDIEDVENILKYCNEVSGKSLSVGEMTDKFIRDVMSWG